MEYFFNVVKGFAEAHDIQTTIGKSIDNLIENDFSEEETESFKTLIEGYLGTSRSGFALSALIDKAKEISKVIKSDDTSEFSDYRKLIKTLITINNEKVLSYLETHILKRNNLPHFFILLEEMVLAKKNTSSIEDSFIQMMHIYKFQYLSVERFLNILSKDKCWLINKLLSFELFGEIISQIHETASNEKEKLKDIAEAISLYTKYTNPVQYSRLMVFMLQYTNEFMDILMAQKNITSHMLEASIIIEQRSLSIKNYSLYLYDKNRDYFLSFERELIDSVIRPINLLEYVDVVPFASKRLVLKRLVSMQAEKELVVFIKKFPEYQNLLPML